MNIFVPFWALLPVFTTVLVVVFAIRAYSDETDLLAFFAIWVASTVPAILVGVIK